MLQVIFIVAAGSAVAPVIMGMVTTVVGLLIETSAALATNKASIVQAIEARDTIVMLMQIYLIIEVCASGLMIAITREGKASKSLIYIPILLLMAFTCYYLASFASQFLIGGLKV